MSREKVRRILLQELEDEYITALLSKIERWLNCSENYDVIDILIRQRDNIWFARIYYYI